MNIALGIGVEYFLLLLALGREGSPPAPLQIVVPAA